MKNIPGYVFFIGLILFIYGAISLGIRGENKPVTKTSKIISVASIIIGIILMVLVGRQPAN